MRKSHRAADQPDLVFGDRMLTEVVKLHSAVQSAPLPLDLNGTAALRERRLEILEQLGDYVIPRLMARQAPMLAVVGGSTGAGKSTLVNTLVGRPVTEAGVLRPTTRSPVLVHHPDDASWFSADQLLPDLRRVNHEAHDQRSIQLVSIATVPRGVAILDAPDVDSVDEGNRHLAGQLLAAADLWLFVTSAARYSDQVPWDYLKQAAERSTAVAIVLDRTPADAVDYVATHLGRMLAARGLKDSPLFRVAEGRIDAQGLLPPGHVREIRQWLEALADDTEARTAIVDQTLSGAVRTLTRKLHPVVDAADDQWAAAEELRSLARRQYAAVESDLLRATRDGTVLRGDLFARWQEFLGSGELIRGFEGKVGFMRDRLVSAVRGKPQQGERVGESVVAALTALVEEHAERAAARTVDAWRATSYGGPVAGADLARASADLRSRAGSAMRTWYEDLEREVRDASGDRAATARFLAYGVRGLAATLAVATLARDHAPAEAAESAALGRRLLDSVFGAEVARQLLDRAQEALTQRIGWLFATEADRFQTVVDRWGLQADAAEQLRHAVRRVDDLRFAAKLDPLGGDL
jgi:hypothetical protein